MIIGGIIKVFISLLGSLMKLLPVIDGSIPTEFITTFSGLVASVSYFLPVNFLIVLFALSVQIEIFNIGWKLLLRTKSFVPFWGN